ncbi:MAG: ParA family protein [Nitrososphaerota archaeon]|nr:ParA family protein [Nitrososphaerota archaeon]
MQTIAVINPKGGTGKSTASSFLAIDFLHNKKKVLLVDLDANAGCTRLLGIEADTARFSNIGELLGRTKVPLESVIYRSDELDFVAADFTMSGLEFRFSGRKNHIGLLAKLFEQEGEGYDFIILDCPPNLRMLTINALAAAHHVFIPFTSDMESLSMLPQMYSTVEYISSLIKRPKTISAWNVMSKNTQPLTERQRELITQQSWLVDRIGRVVVPYLPHQYQHKINVFEETPLSNHYKILSKHLQEFI